MKKLLFLVMTLVCMSWGQAYADFSFSFNSNDGQLALNGNLTTQVVGAQTIITGGSLTSTGSIYSGTLDVGSLTSVIPGKFGVAQYTGYSTFMGPGGGFVTYDNILNPGTPNAPFNNSNSTGNASMILAASTNTSAYGYYLAFCYDGGNQYDVLVYNNAYPSTDIYLNNVTANVTPTPVPAAAWLLGSGLMGLFGLRRREKK